MAEGRMNLAALQQRDPYITDIVDTASQVALYSFNSKANEWEKTSIEGSLFIYKRSASPLNGFMILNRLGLNNLVEPITKDLEFQQQDPFLLYRNAKSIYGVWFYDKDECGRLGGLLNRIVADTLIYGTPKANRVDPDETAPKGAVSSGSTLFANTSNHVTMRFVGDILTEQKHKLGPSPGATMGVERDKQRGEPGGGAGAGAQGSKQQSQVDIMQMLSKAQQEYNTGSSVGGAQGGGARKKTEPKPMIDNPNASATSKASNIIRPKPLKMPDSDDIQDEGDQEEGLRTPLTAGTISLDALFRTASLQQGGGAANQPPLLKRSTSMTSSGDKLVDYADARPGGGAGDKGSSDELPSLLKHIMSTGSMVEDIERQHQVAQDDPIPIMPDLSQPPPNHPAYRGPSPQTQTLSQQKLAQKTKVRKSPRDMKPVAQTDKVLFGLSSEEVGGYGGQAKSAPSSMPQKSMFPLLSTSVAISSQQLISMSQSSSVQISTTQTLTQSKSSPRAHSDYFSKEVGEYIGGKEGVGYKVGEYVGGKECGGYKEKAKEKPQVSPPVSKSEALLTPADLLQPSPAAIYSSHTDKPVSANLDAAAASLTTELLSPMAFVTSMSRKTPPVLPDRSSAAEDRVKDTDQLPIAALTKEQLQQALLYLVKNDSNFISTIHEAYLKSLIELAGKKS